MESEWKERIPAFLSELSQLTIKYGIEIAGCGCCNSPFLVEQNKDGRYKSNACSGNPDDRIIFMEAE